MANLTLVLDGDKAWPELKAVDEAGKLIHVTEGAQICRLARGMQSGKPSLMLRLDLPDGRVLLWETSQECFVAAARAFEGRSAFEAGN